MSSLNGSYDWLETPAGHIFVAQCGSRTAAINAIVQADIQERNDAYALNQHRAMSGQSPIQGQAAIEAVRDHNGPQLTGSAEDIRNSCRDPFWRISHQDDQSASTPIRWEPRSLGIINHVRAGNGLEPLP